jgi:hypothetical protein
VVVSGKLMELEIMLSKISSTDKRQILHFFSHMQKLKKINDKSTKQGLLEGRNQQEGEGKSRGKGR